MELDIYSPDKDGFEVKHRFEGCRVAYLRHAERFDNITCLERHMLTDGIFMLLEGEATLLVGEKTNL